MIESLAPILHDLHVVFEALENSDENADLLARLKEIERELIEFDGTFKARVKAAEKKL